MRRQGSSRAAGSVPPVFIDADDAKTDVILATAVAVIGPTVVGFVTQLPFLPRTGVLGAVLELVWLAVIVLLTPLWLARYRGDGAAAFGLRDTGTHLRVAGTEDTAGGVGPAVLLAVPAALAGAVSLWLLGWPLGAVALGRIGMSLRGGADVGVVALTAVWVVLLSVGTLVLVGFLSVRSREGFPRSPDTELTELVRTFGLGAVALALLTGLVRIVTGGPVALLTLNLAAMIAILLLTDRLVPTGIRVPRTTVVAPLVLVVVLQTFSAGGLFGGGVLLGLHRGALAAGVVVAIAALAATRRGSGAAVALVVAAHWWPTCLSPLPQAAGLC